MPPGQARACPALLVAAPASGQGKTTVTAALALAWRRQGYRVRAFKCGPDFLDPMILERASGAPVYNLDLFLGGEAHVRDLLAAAAIDADLILVEGVMGLFDGTPSTADLAQCLGLPVLGVIDASAMAQTFGALAHGLASYRPGLRWAGVLANRVGSEAHAQMLQESLPEAQRWWGALPRSAQFELPERHLGLHTADSIEGLDARLAAVADALLALNLPLPPAVSFQPAAPAGRPPHTLRGVRVAVARDEALCFIYPANLDTLRALGAELAFFSPLRDAALPPCDAVWLPGGYPELHLTALAANTQLWAALHAHHALGKPMLAECGGLLCLMQSLTDAQGRHARLAGLLPGHAHLQTRLAGLGMHEAQLPEGALRGHAFHYSVLDTPMTPLRHTTPQRTGRRGEAVYRQVRLTASYFHAYFPSNPAAIAALLGP